jgi:SAM-dependent methyltransferase
VKADYRRGDYRAVAERLLPAAEDLVAWTSPSGLVLDVAAGTGNIARTCEALGADVLAVDLVPEQLQVGRSSHGHAIWWVAGDALAIPVREGVADAVLSTFGVVYVDDVERALAELRRVARSGAWLGLSAWPRGGYQDACTAALSQALGGGYDDGHLRRWGTEELAVAHVESVAHDVEARRGSLRSLYASLDDWWTHLTTNAPPMALAADRLSESDFGALREELWGIARTFGRATPDGFELRDDYLLVRGRVR